MEISNKDITIKIGNKQKSFRNLILNNYIDLYAESFISFKDKMLPYCAIKFSKTQDISGNSTTMEYDVILEAELNNIKEVFTENTVINKYMYYKEVNEGASVSDFAGQYITGLGFGNYNNAGEFVLYAFLDVSKYNLTFQANQPIVISRTDKITTDLQFYSPFSKVKFPIHLTMKGLLEIQGMDYDAIYSELYSVGTGTRYNVMANEIPVVELDFNRIETGIITIEGAKNYASYPSTILLPNGDLFPGRTNEGLKELKIEDKEEGLHPSSLLYPNPSLYPKSVTHRWIIYKFKLLGEKWEGTERIVEDTGLYYYQSQKVNLTGKIKLEIKYERA